jgi:hypothetical protein
MELEGRSTTQVTVRLHAILRRAVDVLKFLVSRKTGIHFPLCGQAVRPELNNLIWNLCGSSRMAYRRQHSVSSEFLTFTYSLASGCDLRQLVRQLPKPKRCLSFKRVSR